MYKILEEIKLGNEHLKISDAINEEGLLDVDALHPVMFEDNDLILNKYFTHNGLSLDRLHLPELNEEDFKALCSAERKVKEENKSLDTASDYFIKKMMKKQLAVDLGVRLDEIDFTDYKFDEEHYLFSLFSDNQDYLDNEAWKQEDSRPSSYDNYIKYATDKAPVDTELFEILYNFCISAIQTRTAMLFEVSNILNILDLIIEQSSGFALNCNASLTDMLRSKFKELEFKLKDKEFVGWIEAGNNDISLYAKCDYTSKDYIEYYQKAISGLVAKFSESLEEEKVVFYNKDCPYNKEIFKNEGLTILRYAEDLGTDEE